MKNLRFQKWLVVIGSAAFIAASAQAQDTTVSSTATMVTPAATTPAPVLADSVSQVLQLSQAKVSDSTILSFVQNSQVSYPMAASQIVYLKQQGVSDAVLTAMITHQGSAAPSAPATTYTSASTQSASVPNATAPSVTTYETVPSSSVYVIPDSEPYYYNGYYGYPYPYYAPVGVSIGLGWGWGGGWHGGNGGGWHGGYGGGGWHGGGGGFRGGGGWHH